MNDYFIYLNSFLFYYYFSCLNLKASISSLGPRDSRHLICITARAVISCHQNYWSLSATTHLELEESEPIIHVDWTVIYKDAAGQWLGSELLLFSEALKIFPLMNHWVTTSVQSWISYKKHTCFLTLLVSDTMQSIYAINCILNISICRIHTHDPDNF